MSSGERPLSETAAGDPTPQSVFGHVEFAERVLEMVSTARQEVVICSYDLDRRIYGSDSLVSALRKVLLEHRRGRLRGLVQKPQLAMRGAHRMVELSRALSSRMEFREPSIEARLGSEEYVIVDQRRLLLRSDFSDLEARYYAEAPALAREHLRGFEQNWQQGQVAREFTDLRL